MPWAPHRRGTGGSTSARYCYAVWLRHLTAAAAAVPDVSLGTVVELGPGDSLGTGLAALLAGAGQCLCLDVVPHNDPARDLRVFEDLVHLFAQRADIPGDREFPEMLYLQETPVILDDSRLMALLPQTRSHLPMLDRLLSAK